MEAPKVKGDRMMRNLASSMKSISGLEEQRVRQEDRARAMGNFWREARGEIDAFDVATRLEMRPSEVGMAELGGRAEERDRLWSGSFPKALAIAIEKPEAYLEFCERFNIPPYEGPDNHRPEDKAANKQPSTNSSYLNRRY